MFCDAINKNEIYILSGGCNPYSGMRQIGIMIFPFIEYSCFYFTLTTVAKLRSWNPFVMIKEFPFRSKSDDIILFGIANYRVGGGN